MRIGMMVDSYKPYISGITNYISLSKRHLELTGHEVFVFTFSDQQHPDDDPNVIRSPGLPFADTGYYLSFNYSREAKSLLQTMDVVHVHHPFLSGRLALRYCRPLHIPVIFTNHTRYDLYAQVYLPFIPDEVSETLLHTYMPSFCEAVDLVIAPSAGVAAVLRDLGVRSPVEVVPNGIELQPFLEAQPHPRSRFGFHPEDLLLVYVGRLGREKNLEFLLRAYNGVAQAIENVRLLVIGSGAELEDLQVLAEGLGLSGKVHFTGQVDYDHLPAYLKMCDVFVTASVTEVHPLSVIEAMAAGLPVVGIRSPGVGDTIEDSRTGYLSAEDLASYTAKLTRICLDHEARRTMAGAAYQASQQYAIERTTRLMLDRYERLASSARIRKRGVGFKVRSTLERFRR